MRLCTSISSPNRFSYQFTFFLFLYFGFFYRIRISLLFNWIEDLQQLLDRSTTALPKLAKPSQVDTNEDGFYHSCTWDTPNPSDTKRKTMTSLFLILHIFNTDCTVPHCMYLPGYVNEILCHTVWVWEKHYSKTFSLLISFYFVDMISFSVSSC